jgi:hypothetical protein
MMRASQTPRASPQRRLLDVRFTGNSFRSAGEEAVASSPSRTDYDVNSLAM